MQKVVCIPVTALLQTGLARRPDNRSHITMAFAWRNVFTYVENTWGRRCCGDYTDKVTDSYNRYASICSATIRKSLKESARIQAEKRGELELRYAKWENGVSAELLIARLRTRETDKAYQPHRQARSVPERR